LRWEETGSFYRSVPMLPLPCALAGRRCYARTLAATTRTRSRATRLRCHARRCYACSRLARTTTLAGRRCYACSLAAATHARPRATRRGYARSPARPRLHARQHRRVPTFACQPPLSFCDSRGSSPGHRATVRPSCACRTASTQAWASRRTWHIRCCPICATSLLLSSSR
jgi:hypothetical protein